MSEQLIAAIQTELARLGQVRDRALDSIRLLADESGNSVNLSSQVSDGHQSFFDIDALVTTVLNFGTAFSQETNWNLVPRMWLNSFKDAVANTANSFDNLNNSVAAINAQHGGVASINSEKYTVTTKSGTAVELGKIINNISENLEKVLQSYYTLRATISAPRFSEFGSLFNIFTRRRNEVDNVAKELASIEKQGNQSLSSLQEATKTAKADQNETARLRGEAEKDRKSLTDYTSEASQKLESVKAVHKSADELSAAVSSYQTTFKQFQDQIDTRNNIYNNQKVSFDKLNASLDSKDNEVARLINLAEEMLKGATNAGLAGSYSEKKQEIDRELKKARVAYYLSIALLVFLSLPVFLYSLPRELVTAIWTNFFHFDVSVILGSEGPKSEYQNVVQFFARAVLLIPGFWLVRFSSSRHEKLFRLREHYSYKYSIAMSVEGFMQQAEDYSEEIAAAAYYELAFNPANKMGVSSTDARMVNPVWEWMMKKIEGRTGAEEEVAEKQK